MSRGADQCYSDSVKTMQHNEENDDYEWEKSLFVEDRKMQSVISF